MGDRLAEIARRIEAQAWNRPGADKTWALNAMWEHLRLVRETRRATRGGRQRIRVGYGELAADAIPFRVASTEVRVGRLEKLLRPKELTGRPKDVEFLRGFAARAEEEGNV
jgi:hypothetical protein